MLHVNVTRGLRWILNLYITGVLFCVLQIATVKFPVEPATFPKTVLRKSSSPGEESSIDGEAKCEHTETE